MANSVSLRGRKLTPETKARMSASRTGIKYGPMSEEQKRKISRSKTGKKGWWGGKKRPKYSEEHRRKTSATMKAKRESSHLWRGGVTPINLAIRRSIEYRLWREAVFKRDNYTCVWCGDKRGGNLNADHIKPFAYFPELRFAIDNGRTLCVPCHKRTDTFGEKARKKHRERV